MTYVDPSTDGTPAPGGRIKSAWGAHVQQDLEFFATFYVEAYGATGDGSTDDTAAIQSAINTVSSAGGGTITGRHGAMYKVVPATTGTFGAQVGLTCALTMAANVTLSNISFIKPAYVSGTIAFIGVADSVNNWSISGCTFNGQYSGAQVADYGILIGGASDWSVTGCTFTNLGTKGVQVNANSSPKATRFRINNNNITATCGNAIGIVNIAQFEINGNYIHDLNPAGGGGEAIICANGINYGRIAGNRVIGWGAINLNYTNSVSMTAVDIEGNYVQGANTVGIQGMIMVAGMVDCKIRGNVCDCSLITLTANSEGMSIATATDCVISDNILIGSSSQTQSQILASGLTRVTFANNSITGAVPATAGGSINVSSASTAVKFIGNTCDNAITMGNVTQGLIAGNRAVMSSVTNNWMIICGASTVVANNYIDATNSGGLCNAIRLNGNNCVAIGNTIISANTNTAAGAITPNNAANCVITGNQITLANASQNAFVENSGSNNQFTGNTIVATTPTVNVTGAGSVVRNNQGYNPVGSVSPGVPSSGSAVAAVNYDRTFYVTNGAATNTFAIQNGPTVTLASGVFGTIRVPAGKTLTPTYTSAPTWVVEGE